MAVREQLSADWGVGETGVAGPGKNSRGVAPGVCGIAVVGPGVSKTLMIFPDSTLSAADAYGQAPIMPREEAMEAFSEKALELLEAAAAAAAEGRELLGPCEVDTAFSVIVRCGADRVARAATGGALLTRFAEEALWVETCEDRGDL